MKFKYVNTGQVFEFTKTELKKKNIYKKPKWVALDEEGKKVLEELRNPPKRKPKPKVTE